MFWEQQIQFASLSDIGFRRRNNQDSCAVEMSTDRETWLQTGHLFIVADGMGGHAVGELASKIAVDTVPHTLQKTNAPDAVTALRDAIEAANAAIHERGMANRDFQRMGTTCTALLLNSDGALMGHVGDSRAYRIRDQRIDQLTFDHSLQWELLKQGRMKPEDIFLYEPRNVITRSLGPEAEVQVDIEGPYTVLPGDTYLLCSDGLTGHVNDSEIGIIAAEFPPGDACRLLVNLANVRGGSDNVTVVIARVGEIPEGLNADPISTGGHHELGRTWWWLAGTWVIAATFVAGVTAMLLENTPAGVGLTVVSVVSFMILVYFWWKTKPARQLPPELAETTLWKPYRSASAQFNRKFVSMLAKIEADLQRSAVEEGWEIDQEKYQAASAAVKRALDERKHRVALREYAAAIDVLMAGVHLSRKQKVHEAKWGKSPDSSQPETDG